MERCVVRPAVGHGETTPDKTVTASLEGDQHDDRTPGSLPLHALAEENLAAASPDLLRAMIKTFADALMSAEADALRNAEYGQVSGERVNHRNGYRPREWDTRAGPSSSPFPS